MSEGYGFIFAGLGLALMLYHAVTDGEQEVRRMYGGLAAGLLVLALVSALLPGPFDGTGGSKQMGYYLLPWGIGAGFLALMFAVPFTRHETDDLLRNVSLNALLGVGAVLCGGVVIVGVLFNPEFLAGTGLAFAVLGVGFLCAYLGQVETADGLGYTVAFALGAVGAATLFYAFSRTVFPTVLFDGPAVLRKPNQTSTAGRSPVAALVILVFLGFVALGAVGKFTGWLRITPAVVGLVGAGVFVAASFSTQLTTPPKPFLVPGGLILGGVGGSVPRWSRSGPARTTSSSRSPAASCPRTSSRRSATWSSAAWPRASGWRTGSSTSCWPRSGGAAERGTARTDRRGVPDRPDPDPVRDPADPGADHAAAVRGEAHREPGGDAHQPGERNANRAEQVPGDVVLLHGVLAPSRAIPDRVPHGSGGRVRLPPAVELLRGAGRVRGGVHRRRRVLLRPHVQPDRLCGAHVLRAPGSDACYFIKRYATGIGPTLQAVLHPALVHRPVVRCRSGASCRCATSWFGRRPPCLACS